MSTFGVSLTVPEDDIRRHVFLVLQLVFAVDNNKWTQTESLRRKRIKLLFTNVELTKRTNWTKAHNSLQLTRATSV